MFWGCVAGIHQNTLKKIKSTLGPHHPVPIRSCPAAIWRECTGICELGCMCLPANSIQYTLLMSTIRLQQSVLQAFLNHVSGMQWLVSTKSGPRKSNR